MRDVIAIPLDGSALAEQAVPVAAALARRTGWSIELVHVHGVVYEPADEPPKMAAYLERLAARIHAAGGVEVRSALVEGNPLERLASWARETRPGLVVMTTHGRGGFSKIWIGSVAETMVHRSPVPVLLVRGVQDVALDRAGPIFRRVLIPLDGSAASECALRTAVASGVLPGATVTLAHVRRDAGAAGEDGEMLAQASRRLERAGSGLQDAPECVVLEHDSAAASILDWAARNDVDLISLATRGKGVLLRRLLGSTADKVIRGAECSILLCRPHARPAPRAARPGA